MRVLPPGRATRRRLLASTVLVGLGSGGAAAQGLPAGDLFVSSSVYAGQASTISVGQALPNSNGAAAIADGSYPGVFANSAPDANFGITSPITVTPYLASINAAGEVATSLALAPFDVTAASGVTTSFASKSELALNLSGRSLTFMGYSAASNTLDVSNSDTPGHADPTNTDTQAATYRSVVQLDIGGGVRVTRTDAYSGNNGRAAVLANGEYLMVGNAGNGSGTEPQGIVSSTGVQAIAPGANPYATVVGAAQGTPGAKNGYEFGFSVAQLGDAPDKSGKDDNFRGLRAYGDSLYVSKGSGGNGVNTVYQVSVPGGGLPDATSAAGAAIAILPGFPTGLAASISTADTTTLFFSFGLFFANDHTLYVADEGPQGLAADPNAGLQKWLFDGTAWHLAYTLQAGLNLDAPYQVANYPAAIAPATTGLRNLTGVVDGNTVTLFAVTSTYSNAGDAGADPNAVVRIVDRIDATTPPAGAAFTTVAAPESGRVYRGVQYAACQTTTQCYFPFLPHGAPGLPTVPALPGH